MGFFSLQKMCVRTF